LLCGAVLNFLIWVCPRWKCCRPFTPSRDGVAISARSLRLGHVFHTAYPPHAFDWLDQYRPKEWVGKTIRLYYIPPDTPTNNAGEPKQSQ
jgi:hypothetical protein